MKPFPHHYQASARSVEEGYTTLTSHGLNPIVSAAPAEFNGPGDLWSPEPCLLQPSPIASS
jgi:hypothetical protein